MAKILRSVSIDYVKWDMNRELSDLGSSYLDKDSQQELFHRYVLGLYKMQERLITEFLICYWKTAPEAVQDLTRECYIIVHRSGAQMIRMQ